VHAHEGLSGPAGSTLDDQLTIACAQGAVQPIIVQPAGKSAMALADYLRGQPIATGTRF
jgi:methionyl-tRNA formyltransferase